MFGAVQHPTAGNDEVGDRTITGEVTVSEAKWRFQSKIVMSDETPKRRLQIDNIAKYREELVQMQ